MKTQPTEAEKALSNLFETRRARFTEAPLDAARAAAFARFAAEGLPHRRVEAYKYTDLRARLRELPEPSGPVCAEAVAARLRETPPLQADACRIVIANGHFVPELSVMAQGVQIASLLDPLADTSAVGRLVADSDDPLTLVNVGLFDGGALVHVTEAAAPVEIVHVAVGGGLSMGRVAVVVAPGGRVRIAERVLGQAGTVENALTELTLHEGAGAEWIRLEDGASPEAVHLGTLHVRLAARATFDHLTVSTGRGLSRNQIFAHVAGEDAQANFRTAAVALGLRHADNTLVVRHDAVGSRSSEIFRSAVGEGGTSIVQGRIIVDPGAQRTDARMMSNALFLDDTGEVVNKPELEIFADDVQCGHGATSGDLDEDMIFYMRARGVPEATARRLLVEAFLVEALDRVADDGLREALAERLREALGRKARP